MNAVGYHMLTGGWKCSRPSGQGLEQPGLTESVRAHDSGLKLQVPFYPNQSMILIQW